MWLLGIFTGLYLTLATHTSYTYNALMIGDSLSKWG